MSYKLYEYQPFISIEIHTNLLLKSWLATKQRLGTACWLSCASPCYKPGIPGRTSDHLRQAERHVAYWYGVTILWNHVRTHICTHTHDCMYIIMWYYVYIYNVGPAASFFLIPWWSDIIIAVQWQIILHVLLKSCWAAQQSLTAV